MVLILSNDLFRGEIICFRSVFHFLEALKDVIGSILEKSQLLFFLFKCTFQFLEVLFYNFVNSFNCAFPFFRYQHTELVNFVEILAKILSEFFAESFWTIRAKGFLVCLFKFGFEIFHVGDLNFKFIDQEFLNGEDLIWPFDFFGFKVFASIIKKLFIRSDLSFGDFIGLEKFLKIVFDVTGFLVFLASVGLGSQETLHLALVKLFFFDIIFLEFKVFFVDGFFFIGIDNKLNTGVQGFKDLLESGNVGFFDFDKRLIQASSAMVEDLGLGFEAGFFGCALFVFLFEFL